MKTFKDLEFKKEVINDYKTKEYAKLFFCNGFGISVIKGFGAYGNKYEPYELAVLKGNKDNFCIHYDNEVALGDVVGFLTKKDVTELMIKVQNFKL